MKSNAPSRRCVLQTLGVGITVGTAGCSVFGSTVPIDELRVNIDDIRSPSLGATSATLPLILLAENPTSQSIPSPTGEFDVKINDQSGMTTDFSFNTIDPGETTRKRISVFLDYAEVGRAVAEAVASGQFNVQLDGHIESKGNRTDLSLQSDYRG